MAEFKALPFEEQKKYNSILETITKKGFGPAGYIKAALKSGIPMIALIYLSHLGMRKSYMKAVL
jgi:hypothetical protein